MIFRDMMRAKIHGAIVTDKNLHYTGSLAVDANLLETAGILHNERIQVVNLANGERLWTYAIRAEPGSGQVVLNGGTAHKGEIGDRLLLITYAHVEEESLPQFTSRVVVVGKDNRHFDVRSS